MTTLPKGTKRIMSAIVKDKAARYGADGEIESYELELYSDFFRTERPQKLKVPAVIGEKLRKGIAKSFVLKSGNIRKNKDGQQHDGQMPWMYWWDFVALAGEDAQIDAPPQNGHLVETAQKYGGKVVGVTDERKDNIECPPFYPNADKYSGANIAYDQWHMDRRTALMQAVKRCKDTELDEIAFANRYFVWLRGGAPDLAESLTDLVERVE